VEGPAAFQHGAAPWAGFPELRATGPATSPSLPAAAGTVGASAHAAIPAVQGKIRWSSVGFLLPQVNVQPHPM